MLLSTFEHHMKRQAVTKRSPSRKRLLEGREKENEHHEERTGAAATAAFFLAERQIPSHDGIRGWRKQHTATWYSGSRLWPETAVMAA